MAVAEPRFVVGVACTVAVVLGLAIGSPLIAVAGPVLAVAAAAEAGRRSQQRAEARRQTGLPVVLDHMIQELRSGLGLRTVCSRPMPVAEEVDDAVAPLAVALAEHRSLADAVAELQMAAGVRQQQDVELMAVTLAALADRGAPAAAALGRLRLTLMGAVEARARARAQAGQARASAALLAGAPALFALVIAVADPDVGRLYLYQPIGTVCVTVALVFTYAGWRWMSREVDRALGSDEAGNGPGAAARTIDLVAMTVGAGGTTADGVAVVAERGPPVAREAFARVVDRQRHGDLLVDALPHLTESLGVDYHPLVVALTAADQGGAPIGTLLQRLADEAEQARRRSVELSLARLPVRLLVPLVVCQLPAVIVGAVTPLTIVALRHLRG